MKIFGQIYVSNSRVFGLDILRALAILFVVLEHGNLLLPLQISSVIHFVIFDGVTLFFVLSGFLIGGILLKTLNKQDHTPKTIFNFWKRRWFRILPNYFLILLILCFCHLFFSEGYILNDIYKYFYFGQNIFDTHPMWFFTEAWSLSIEEWFYLIIPLLLVASSRVLHRNVKKGVLFSSLLLIVLVTAFRLYRFDHMTIISFDDWDLFFRKQVATRLDSIMYGVIAAYIQFYYQEKWLKYKKELLIIGIFLLLLSKFIIPRYAGVDSLYNAVFSFSLISIATVFLLPFLSVLKSNGGILFRSITFISLISYSMYLLNLSLIQRWIIQKVDWSFISTDLNVIILCKYSLFWILLLVLSYLLYRYFETPMTKLREKI